MAVSNQERVGRALELLNEGLRPFIQREMQAVYGAQMTQQLRAILQSEGRAPTATEPERWDTAAMLKILELRWKDVFIRRFGNFSKLERSLVGELQDVRNRWAHQEPWNGEDTYRALDSVQRLLNAISARDQAVEVGQEKEALRREIYTDQISTSLIPEARPQEQTVPTTYRSSSKIPDVSRAKLLEAIKYFDANLRGRGEWLNWEANPRHLYAILHEGRRYPVKQIIAFAADVERTSFSGGAEANSYVQARGFQIVRLEH